MKLVDMRSLNGLADAYGFESRSRYLGAQKPME